MNDVEQVGDRSAVPRLQDGVRFLRRRLRSILLTALACAVIAIVITQSLEPRYRSTAELIIEGVPVANVEEGQTANAMDESAFVDGQAIVLQSSDLLKRVLSDPTLLNDPEIAGTGDPTFADRVRGVFVSIAGAFGLGASPEESARAEADPMFRAVQRLRNMVTVLREGRSTVITVSVTANDPDKAARIANEIVETYIARQTEVQSERAERISARLNTRLGELRQRVLAAEDAVEAYRSQHGMHATQVGTLSEQQLSELNGQLVQTRADLYEKQAILDRAQNLIDTGGDIYSLRDLMDSELLSDLRLRLLEVTRRESELLSLFGDSNASLEQVRAEKNDLELRIQTEIERLISMLTNELEVTKAREALLLTALDKASDVVTIEGQGEVELRELQRVASAYSALYERLLERAGNVGALVGAPLSDVRLISPAVASSTAVFPPDKLIVVLGLILGAGLGLLWALAKEAMNPGFVTSRQAEAALGVPVLAALPQTRGARSAKDLLLEIPDSPYAEAVRTLRHTLLTGMARDDGRLLQVTSSLPGEGKTTLAVSLAISAAAAGYRVLLMDADLRRKDLTWRFDLMGRPGLTDASPEAASLQQAVQHDKQSGVFVLPAGTATGSASDFLGSARMRGVLEWARANFDLVVVDSPEIGNMADAVILAEYSDQVLLVVRWSSTPADIAGDCLGKIDPSKVRGIAINAYDLRKAASYGDHHARFARLQGGHAATSGKSLGA